PDGKNILYSGSHEKNYHISKIANDVKAKPEIILDNIHGVLWSEWGHPNLAFVQGAHPGGMQEGLLTIFNPITTEVHSEIPTMISFWFLQKWNPKRPLVPLLQPSGNFGKLSLYNAESGELREIPQPDGEIAQSIWSSDGEKLFQRSMIDGRSVVHEIDIDENSFRMVDLPVGNITPYYVREWKGKQILFFVHTDAGMPNELWSHNLETGLNEKLTQWQSGIIGTEAFPVVASKSLTYKSSFDRKSIHGFLLLPSDSPPAEGYPCIAYIHGGPVSHISDEFRGWFQVLAQEGFAVFAPNFRGSTGYGEAFMKSLFQEAGRADLQDVSSGVDYVVENFDVNPRRVGICGGSYGGFMTLAALAFQPDRWAAGYASAPIADWTYLHTHHDALFKEFTEYMWGDPKEHQALMLERSPISRVDDVKAPLGISQTANDSRTPLAPVLEFANKLLARNHTLELHITPNAGHLSINKNELIRELAGRISFFKTYLDSKD
ncbi:MAG: prolyl oligopeptidase family serine peptidase, partial [Candidatus Thorarchaeota archaeon]